MGGYEEKKMGVFSRGLLVFCRIGTLFWTIGILVGICWCFGNWGFWEEWRVVFGNGRSLA